MEYRDLQDLIDRHKESREYFYALPSRTQMQLHRHDSLVTSNHELLRYAEFFSRIPEQEKEPKPVPKI